MVSIQRQSYRFLEQVKTSKLKTHNKEKMALKAKKPIFQYHLNNLL